MMAIGAKDPTFTPADMVQLRQQIRNGPTPTVIPDGGHLGQTLDAQIAAEALRRLS